MAKGILVSVFRSRGDSTNGGVTAEHNDFVLVGKGIPEIFEPSEGTPALQLHWRGTPPSGGHAVPYAVPVDPPKPGKATGPMMGGNFIYTCDSRLRRIWPSPIAVHDRYETRSDYASHND